MFIECKISKAWTTNIHFTDGTMYVLDQQKYLCTFQVFIDATKITNVWSQQHSLFLEWANLEFIVAHVESVPACTGQESWKAWGNS